MQQAVWIDGNIVPVDEQIKHIDDVRDAVDKIAKDNNVDITAAIDSGKYTIVMQHRRKKGDATERDILEEDVMCLMRLVQGIAKRHDIKAVDVAHVVKEILKEQGDQHGK